MRAVLRTLPVLGLYVGLVAWLTWPLAAHLTTHLPDQGVDVLLTTWALAWQTHALVTAPATLLDGNIYYPAPHAVLYGHTAFSALPLFAPTFLATGNPGLAINVTFLGGAILTAWALHLVVHRWTDSHLAGFVAAWAVLTTRWMLWDWAPSVPDYSTLFYFPAILYLAARPLDRWRCRLALLALVVLQCLTDLIYIAPAVLVPLTLIGVGRLARRGGVRLLAIVAFAVLLLLPLALAYVALREANPGFRTQTAWPGDLSQPPTQVPCGVFGLLRPVQGFFFVPTPSAVPLAALLLISLGALSAWRSRSLIDRTPWVHCAVWAAAGVLMSLTPTVTWDGRPIRLPHAAVRDWLPLIAALRVPARLGVAAMIGLAALTGLAFAACARLVPTPRRLPAAAPLVRASLAALLAVAMYAQYARGTGVPAGFWRSALPASYPLRAAPQPPDPALLAILRQPGGPLLEVPAGYLGDGDRGVTSPEPHARALYRSIFHWRPLLNGYSGYWPAGFPERMTVANHLPDPEALAALRRETGLALVQVNTGGTAPKSHPWMVLADHAGGDGLRLLARTRTALLFAVEPLADAPLRDKQASEEVP